MGGYTQKSVDLDPGFGSSNFGVCITELVDILVNVIHEGNVGALQRTARISKRINGYPSKIQQTHYCSLDSYIWISYAKKCNDYLLKVEVPGRPRERESDAFRLSLIFWH